MNTVLEEKFNKYRNSFFKNDKSYHSKRLMKNSEIEIYTKLLDIYKEQYYVFPQVALSAYIETDVKEHNLELFRFPDFLLCDMNFYPVAVIELNGRTHNDDYSHLRDTSLNLILKQSQLPIIQLNIKRKISNNLLKSTIDNIIHLHNHKTIKENYEIRTKD